MTGEKDDHAANVQVQVLGVTNTKISLFLFCPLSFWRFSLVLEKILSKFVNQRHFDFIPSSKLSFWRYGFYMLIKWNYFDAPFLNAFLNALHAFLNIVISEIRFLLAHETTLLKVVKRSYFDMIPFRPLSFWT